MGEIPIFWRTILWHNSHETPENSIRGNIFMDMEASLQSLFQATENTDIQDPNSRIV